jgi:pyruvate ferredoxin oxidoreductase beta subunit
MGQLKVVGDKKMSILGLPEEEYLYPGFGGCPGCGSFLALRHVMKALGKKTIFVIPAGCIAATTGLFPKTPFKVPMFETAFETTASLASGVIAALKIKRKEDVTVVGFAGDGGTYDIGIQALSGAAERGENLLYICYDNEAYMNTGTQRSGATPLGATTTTTPIIGKQQHKKDMPLIMVAHKISYVATACSSYPHDLFKKVTKAKEKKGTRYIHILCPCPSGWGFDTKRTVEIGKLAVQSGIWTLYEIEDGTFKLTGPSRGLIDQSKRKSIREYLKTQGRFSHLTEDKIETLREWVNNQWKNYEKLSRK